MTRKALYYKGCSLLPLPLLMRAGGQPSLFPYHHIVSDEAVPHIMHLYPYKNAAQFTEDVDFLLQHYKPIHPEELGRLMRQGDPLPRNRFLLTFDDGFRQVKEVIAPILKSKGVPAIFFINPAFIGNEVMFYRNKISLLIHHLLQQPAGAAVLQVMAGKLGLERGDKESIRLALLHTHAETARPLDELGALLGISFSGYLQQHRPWLEAHELETLARQGFTIGAHSWDHPHYQLLHTEGQLQQTLQSCRYVAHLQQPVLAFSFPHTDEGLPQNLFDQLLQAETVHLLFGTQNQKRERHNRMIHRFNAERPALPLRRQLNGVLVYDMLQRLAGQHKIKRPYA